MPAFIIMLIWVVIIVACAAAAIQAIRYIGTQPFNYINVAIFVIGLIAIMFILYMLWGWIPPFPGGRLR